MKPFAKTLALALTLAALAVGAQAQGHDYNTKHALIYRSVTPQQLVALPDTTPVAMTCPKCKTVMLMTKRDLGIKPGRDTVIEAIATDTCPGCGKKMVLKRGGKETEWVHSCKDCGEHTVTCCALMPAKPAPAK